MKDAGDGVPQAHMHQGFRNELKLDTLPLKLEAVIHFLHVMKAFVESADTFVQLALHAETAAASVRQVRRIPDSWHISSLSGAAHSLNPGGIQLLRVKAARHEIVLEQRVTDSRHPSFPHFIIGITERQRFAGGCSSADIERVRTASPCKRVDDT
jgi:hypothetical protein